MTWPPKEEDHRHPTIFLLTKKEYEYILQSAEECESGISNLVVTAVFEYMQRHREQAKPKTKKESL